MNSNHTITPLLPFRPVNRPPPADQGCVDLPAHALVAHEDDAMQEITAEWFRTAGYRVSMARSREAACKILCAESVDVLMTDRASLARLRRGHEETRKLPLILNSRKMPSNELALLSPLAFRRKEPDRQVMLAFDPARPPQSARSDT